MTDKGNGTDFLGGSGILRYARITREEFNPTDGNHLESLRTFLATGNWGLIQFYAEAPYLTVPETVLRKMANAGLVAAGY
jgi:hypothetical protein